MMTRRELLAAAGAAGLAGLGTSGPRGEARAGNPAVRRASGSQRRWRAAFGLNGFMSSEHEFKQTFPIWEVLDFAQREGFEGIELVGGWPQGGYPAPDQGDRIAALRGLYDRYNVKVFSVQTDASGAFRKDRSARDEWVKSFGNWAAFARKVGCECIGLWPGGGLDGQSLDEATDRLIESLVRVAGIASDEGLLASVEIEPPFVFHAIDVLIKIIDGVNHPSLRAMYDPSHFDVMNGGKGKPEELLERLGVDRVGYIHLTDTDGTQFGGTSKHLPCGDGHVDIPKSLDVLWKGGYEGWIMIDAWKTRDPYDACRKGKAAIDAARKRGRESFLGGR